MLDARIATERQLENMPSAIRKMYKRISFVYAHGRLETDFGTDIFYIFKGDSNICNGLIAYTQDNKPVKFYLYKHPRTFELTGIVTYCNEDKEANEYGRHLVELKPQKF